MMTAKLMDYEVVSKQSIYPDLPNQVNMEADTIKALLPFLATFSFLDAYQALYEMTQFGLDDNFTLSINNKSKYLYEIHRTCYLLLNTHALLQPTHPNETWLNDNLNETIDQLFKQGDSPLRLAKYLDEGLKSGLTNSRYSYYPKNIQILIELRKVFLRFHALENDLDLREYLD